MRVSKLLKLHYLIDFLTMRVTHNDDARSDGTRYDFNVEIGEYNALHIAME